MRTSEWMDCHILCSTSPEIVGRLVDPAAGMGRRWSARKGCVLRDQGAVETAADCRVDDGAGNGERRLTMDVEYTAKQGKITKGLRALAEDGLEKMGKLLGKTASANIVFGVERHLQVVELKIQARSQKIAATGKGATQSVALRQALEHAENQARRYRDRRLESKRLPKEEKILTAPPVTRHKARAAEPTDEAPAKKPKAKVRASIAVHSFPAKATVVEPHIVSSAEAIALKPMTMEEAVKEAEFRDKDLLIFHTPGGETYVLHRRRDGQMELVEMP